MTCKEKNTPSGNYWLNNIKRILVVENIVLYIENTVVPFKVTMVHKVFTLNTFIIMDFLGPVYTKEQIGLQKFVWKSRK